MTKRKDGRWQERYFEQGMEKPKYFYSVESTEKKAWLDISRQIEEFKNTHYQKKHNFFNLCEQALESKEKDLEYNTQEMYKYAFKRIPEAFNIDIEDIKPLMVQKLLVDLSNKQYSYSAIHQVKVLFGVVFDYAILQGVGIFNFMSSIKMPKNVKQKKIHSPDDEVIDFIRFNADETHFGLWPLFILATGCRRGEANSVQKSDIDFINKLIHIRHSTEFIVNSPRVKETKSDDGLREVPLLDILYEPLKRHCKKLKASDYIFGGKSPLTKSGIRYNFDKYKKICNYNFTSHQVRHAYAKLLYVAGVDVKTAQGLLGHANIQITMDLYTDFEKSMNVKAGNKINEYLQKNNRMV